MNISLVNGQVENILLIVIIQLTVIIIASRIFSAIFRKIGQPQVCGDIFGGLILGPSLFGGMFPDLFHRVFDPSVGQILSILSQLGLVLLMFLIGLEFDFGHLDENRKTAMSISTAGIIVPFGLGFLLGGYMHGKLGLSGNPFHLAMFMAAAMSITAIPILGRIMIELNINRTRLGSLTISAAAMDDASGWIILAFVTAMVKSTFDPAKLALMIAEVVFFALVMMFGVRPLLIKWSRSSLQKSGGNLSLDALAMTFILIFVCAICTNLIGIFSVFGAFFLGSILYDQHQLVDAIRRRLNDFITVFFLPVFFTYTGLRTDIGSMSGTESWMMCGLVLLVATVGKFGGCTLAAKANNLPWRESAIIGVMMNTRGSMALIVINIGYDLGIIPKNVFFMLVFMAVVTTCITAPVLRRLAPKSEIEKEYSASAFSQA